MARKFGEPGGNLDSSSDSIDNHVANSIERMLGPDYCPAEIVVELSKCILGMLHFRVLSWI